jgi:hypothetical protein
MTTQPNTLLANSWKRHYDDHPFKQLSNSKLSNIKYILAHGTSPEACVAQFANSPDLFGLGVSPNKRELCLLHNSSVLGGNWLDPIGSWAALLGITPNATTIEIDQTDSLTPVTFRCPTFNKLFNTCSDAASFSQLTAEDSDDEVSLRSMICLPPPTRGSGNAFSRKVSSGPGSSLCSSNGKPRQPDGRCLRGRQGPRQPAARTPVLLGRSKQYSPSHPLFGGVEPHHYGLVEEAPHQPHHAGIRHDARSRRHPSFEQHASDYSPHDGLPQRERDSAIHARVGSRRQESKRFQKARLPPATNDPQCLKYRQRAGRRCTNGGSHQLPAAQDYWPCS